MDVSRYEASAALTEPACRPCQDWRTIVIEVVLEGATRSLELPCRGCQPEARRDWIRKHVPDEGDLVVVLATGVLADVVPPAEGSPIQPGHPGGEPMVLISRRGDSTASWIGLEEVALLRRAS